MKKFATESTVLFKFNGLKQTLKCTTSQQNTILQTFDSLTSNDTLNC